MPNAMKDSFNVHCVKSARIRSYFSSNTGKYGPEITPHLDTFHAVLVIQIGCYFCLI